MNNHLLIISYTYVESADYSTYINSFESSYVLNFLFFCLSVQEHWLQLKFQTGTTL